MNLSEKQAVVAKAAVDKLKNEPWFRGVCLNNIATDDEIDRDGFDYAVDALVIDTAYYDDPDVMG